MTNYTRRSFVKRSGSATLGAALGLGLLPSLTRKLHAGDTSTCGGGGTSGSIQVLLGDLPKPVSQSYRGGVLSLSLAVTLSAAPAACVPSILVTVRRTARYDKSVNGSSYVGLITRTDLLYWRCQNGAPYLFDEQHYEPGSVAIANVNNPNDVIGNLDGTAYTSGNQQNSWYSAAVTLNEALKETSPPLEIGPASYQPVCCL
jgi:hypothetical protein